MTNVHCHELQFGSGLFSQARVNKFGSQLGLQPEGGVSLGDAF